MVVLREGGSNALSWKWSEGRVGWQLRTLTGHTRSVRSVAFSPDGKRGVSGSWDNLVKIWDAATGAEVRSQLCASYLRVKSCWGNHLFVFIL